MNMDTYVKQLTSTFIMCVCSVGITLMILSGVCVQWESHS